MGVSSIIYKVNIQSNAIFFSRIDNNNMQH